MQSTSSKARKLVEKLIGPQSLVEMAYLSDKNDHFVVEVHSHEHNPPHFHFKVKGEPWVVHVTFDLEVCWSSPRQGVARHDLLTWSGLEKHRKTLAKWLSAKSSVQPRLTNLEMVETQWNIFQRS